MTVRASHLKRPLAARLREDREQLRVQGSQATLARSGMSVTAEAEVTVDGDFVVGGTLNVTGNTVIGGTLSLPAGIIGNDALANPLAAGVAHADAVGFSLNKGANATIATATIPVPAGFTRALVTATAAISAFNSTAASDYLYCVAYIQADTVRGWSLPVSVSPSDSGMSTQTATALLTGLSGSFYVKVAGSTANAAWATSTSGNVANIDATVVFLR